MIVKTSFPSNKSHDAEAIMAAAGKYVATGQVEGKFEVTGQDGRIITGRWVISSE